MTCILLSVDDTPSTLDLHIYVARKVVKDWYSLAIYLKLDDVDIRDIRQSHLKESEKCLEMLKLWKEGKGRTPTTWKTLIEALNFDNLGELSKDIESDINKISAV